MHKRSKARSGRAKAWSPTAISTDFRSAYIDKKGLRWRWVVDNRMRDYGDIDFERRIIRINRERHALDGESLIDTLFHEDLHRLFPYLGERTVCCMTEALLPTLSARYRSWLYARIRRRA